MDYEWVCNVCRALNESEAHSCRKCNAPAELNQFEIVELRKKLAEGEVIQPLTRSSSPSLNRYYWFVEVSDGKNFVARTIGNTVWWLGLGMLAAMLLVKVLLPESLDIEWIAIPLIFLGILEIRNFSLGKETFLGYVVTPATEENAVWRWLGLVLDMWIISIGVSMVSFGGA
ncbi:hypothetical protein DFR30_0883 [Thiogranum longum]|uniref:RanBP2-type domain-containing protein n=1 Tax=Thiogranum longum TaxID=1537524 RepID=A0A4R1H8R7_9GAMM|nr:hypothetical protein [Thiogranum longum]TCK17648.1 hypothetical protein DFR30_0883 [Thiogranum longum]